MNVANWSGLLFNMAISSRVKVHGCYGDALLFISGEHREDAPTFKAHGSGQATAVESSFGIYLTRLQKVELEDAGKTTQLQVSSIVSYPQSVAYPKAQALGLEAPIHHGTD